MNSHEKLVFDALIMIVTNTESLLNEARELKNMAATGDRWKWWVKTNYLIRDAYDELHRIEPEIFQNATLDVVIRPEQFLENIPDLV
jgi:hypothetical protein